MQNIFHNDVQSHRLPNFISHSKIIALFSRDHNYLHWYTNYKDTNTTKQK
jgi:hypothetical protein